MSDKTEKSLSKNPEPKKEPNNASPETAHSFSRQYELNSLINRKLELEYRDYEYSKKLQEEKLSETEQIQIKMQISEIEKEHAAIEEKIEEVQMIIEQEQASSSRGKHYDKYLAFRNIRELLKKTDIKLGQIEKEAGCQAGYMSRLEKTENATEPTTEFLVTAAQSLGVSLDTLINTTISEMTSTELYMIRFLEKLIRDTETDKLNWTNEPLYTFREIEKSDDGQLEHPLFSRYQNHEGMSGIAVNEAGLPYIKIHSYFPSKSFGRLTVISGDCYHLEMKDKATLYIMSVSEAGSDEKTPGKTAVEVWMHNKNGKTTCLCTDHEGKEMIVQLVFKLWLAVNQYDTRPKISKEHRDIIDSFLRDDFDEDITHDATNDQTV